MARGPGLGVLLWTRLLRPVWKSSLAELAQTISLELDARRPRAAAAARAPRRHPRRRARTRAVEWRGLRPPPRAGGARGAPRRRRRARRARRRASPAAAAPRAAHAPPPPRRARPARSTCVVCGPARTEAARASAGGEACGCDAVRTRANAAAACGAHTGRGDHRRVACSSSAVQTSAVAVVCRNGVDSARCAVSVRRSLCAVNAAPGTRPAAASGVCCACVGAARLKAASCARFLKRTDRQTDRQRIRWPGAQGWGSCRGRGSVRRVWTMTRTDYSA